MESNTYCYHCDKMVTYTTCFEHQVLHVSGKPIPYTPVVCKCDSCGEKVHVEEYFNVNLQHMKDIYIERGDICETIEHQLRRTTL